MRAAAIILGAGSGTRVGADRNKVLLDLVGVPVLARSVRTALEVPEVELVVLTVRPGEEPLVSEALAPHLGDAEVLMVPGGRSRHASEVRALRTVAAMAAREGAFDVVAVHDGARPLASVALWQELLVGAARDGGAVPVRPVTGLVARQDLSRVRGLAGMQTPQAFRAEPLMSAYAAAAAAGFEGTDTAATVARYAPEVQIGTVPGPARNIKVTFARDMEIATNLL